MVWVYRSKISSDHFRRIIGLCRLEHLEASEQPGTCSVHESLLLTSGI